MHRYDESRLHSPPVATSSVNSGKTSSALKPTIAQPDIYCCMHRPPPHYHADLLSAALKPRSIISLVSYRSTMHRVSVLLLLVLPSLATPVHRSAQSPFGTLPPLSPDESRNEAMDALLSKYAPVVKLSWVRQMAVTVGIGLITVELKRSSQAR